MIVLFLSSITQAQLTKGIWLVGGSGSFDSYRQEYTVPPPSLSFTYDYKVFDVSAMIGYFIVDKLVIGAKPAFTYYKGESEYES